jgi:predicted dehydrogenase
MGLIGGGPGSFIGRIHRLAAELDGEAELVCGTFSSLPERSRAAGETYRLEASRVYDSVAELLAAEQALPAEKRMDFAAIVTPNHLHFQQARLCLESGFHVVMDKPMCFSLEEARALQEIVARTGRVLAITYTYSGYPLVKQARALIAAGRIGTVRKVYVEYPQGWLSSHLERTGNKQALWRTDPQKAGTGAIGDIGTHAAHLAEYVSGLHIQAVSAELHTFVPGRRVDDDCTVMLRFDNGATGVLFATQVAAGEENGLRIRVYGESGGIEWQQAEPNSLILRSLTAPLQVMRAGWGYLEPIAIANSRTPPGHPEGYLEAFANIYRTAFAAIRDHISNPDVDIRKYDVPSVADGARGMEFIDAVTRSARSTTRWLELT